LSGSATRTSFLLGTLNLLVKPVSMVKDIVVASYFGTSAAMDAFFVALGIPTFVISLLGSPVASGFTPVFIRERAKKLGLGFYRESLGTILLVASGATAVCWLLREPLVRIIGPGLGGEGQTVAVATATLLLPYLVFHVLADFQRTTLVALRRFVSAAILPALLPAITLASLWVLGPTLRSLTLGMTVGAGVVAVAATGVLMRGGFAGVSLPRGSQPLAEMWRQTPLLMVGGILLQANLLIDRSMASTLPEGSVAALSYSYRLLMLTQMVLVTPLNQLVLTYFSEHVARQNWREIVSMTDRAIRSSLLLLIPICVFGVVFAHHCVSFIYERGEFTVESSRATAVAFAAYLPTTLIQGATLPLPRYFNVARRNHILIVQTSISLVLNVVLNLVFMRMFGHAGIALSTSVTVLVGRMILFFHMGKETKVHAPLHVVHHLGTLALGGATLGLVWLIEPWIPTPGGHLFVRLVLAGLATLMVYLPLVFLLRRQDAMGLASALLGGSR